jgi:hypothetical protein
MTEPWDRFETLVERAADTPDGAQGVLTVVGYRGGEGFHARVGSTWRWPAAGSSRCTRAT